MQRGTKVTDPELPVKLTDEQMIQRAQIMAGKLTRIQALRKKRREDLRSINALIESELDEVQRIANTIITAEEMRKQSELHFDEDPRNQERVEPTAGEAQDALAKVAQLAEVMPPKFHAKGERCDKNPCRRRHLSEEQLRANGIEPEGAAETAEEEDVRAKCTGCNAVLTATEVVKKLGLCESCQVQIHEEVNVQGAEGEGGEPDEHEGVDELDEATGDDDEPAGEEAAVHH